MEFIRTKQVSRIPDFKYMLNVCSVFFLVLFWSAVIVPNVQHLFTVEKLPTCASWQASIAANQSGRCLQQEKSTGTLGEDTDKPSFKLRKVEATPDLFAPRAGEHCCFVCWPAENRLRFCYADV